MQAAVRNTSMMRRAVWITLALAVAPLLAGCPGVPGHETAWLSAKYSADCGAHDDACSTQLSDAGRAYWYYVRVGVPDPDTYTFDMWLTDSGFAGGSPVARAVYGNLADLQFGRDMNCTQSDQRIACYVLNFGYPPLRPGPDGRPEPDPRWPDITFALAEAVRPGLPLGAVAMIYDPGKEPGPVSFYAFGDRFIDPDGDGVGETRSNALLYRVALDQEGEKSVPRMCMACHGGTYNTDIDTVTGAAFLPFDVFSFRFSDKPGFTFDEQQEELRKLNALVAATHPGQPALDLINGLYPGGVTNAGSPAVDGWVPPGWSDNPTLYTSVVRPYCRTCHVAQPITFTSYSEFEDVADRLARQLCDRHAMPHAQIPYGVDDTVGFWNDRVAQHDLREFFGGLDMSSCMPDE